MPTPPSPAAPTLSQPSQCCPPPSLTLTLDIVRNGALDCSDTTPAHEVVPLTFNGTNLYSGTFSYVSDVYTVHISLSLGMWSLLISNVGGCGFANCAYNHAAGSWLGPWPDDDVHAAGVCGCGDLHIFYQSIATS